MKYLRVTMPDKTMWDVPVSVIAECRARYYAIVDDVSFEESLNNDTLPLFEEDESMICDWAANNMNWQDVAEYAKRVDLRLCEEEGYQDSWVNGGEIVEY